MKVFMGLHILIVMLVLILARAQDGPSAEDLKALAAQLKESLPRSKALAQKAREMTAQGAFKDDPTIASQGIDATRQEPLDLPLIMAAINTAGANGPCSPADSAVTILVKREGDFAKRLAYPPTTTVKLVMQVSITLTKGLLFDASYACTILTVSSRLLASRGANLYLGTDTTPTLRIWNTSNIILLGVNVKLKVANESPFCPVAVAPEIFPLVNMTVCPSIHIYKSYGIVIAKGNMFGRVDIIRCMQVTVDSNKLTGPDLYEVSPGAIHVGKSGLGGRLVRSNIVISNNEIYSVNTPVTLLFGAVGVSVINNFIHNFIWTGIRCAAFTSFSGDCMLSNIANNYIYNPPGYPVDYDSTGIYFYTHWINPGNSLSCNYIVGSYHCMYLDNVSSGIKVAGGVCANTFDGIKINNGKNNVIKGVITYNMTQNTPGWVSCLLRSFFNCLIAPGTLWESNRIKYYNSRAINTAYPFMKTICAAKSLNGVVCNPAGKNSLPGSQTGYCSGLPTENVLDIVMVDAKLHRNPEQRFCEELPAVPKLISVSFPNITSAAARFNNLAGLDFGFKRTSGLRAVMPGIPSCPKAVVGIKSVPAASYYNSWNIAKPASMDLVRTVFEFWVTGYN